MEYGIYFRVYDSKIPNSTKDMDIGEMNQEQVRAILEGRDLDWIAQLIVKIMNCADLALIMGEE